VEKIELTPSCHNCEHYDQLWQEAAYVPYPEDICYKDVFSDLNYKGQTKLFAAFLEGKDESLIYEDMAKECGHYKLD
jgi:hypothetical protein